MPPTPEQLAALTTAQTLIFHSDFCPYLELKEMLPDQTALARHRFRSLFTSYYNLNIAGLTVAFKDRFFEILFDGQVIIDGQPNYEDILMELYQIPRAQEDHAMQFSFVSKLVAMHDDASPIFDRHVCSFFGIHAPGTATPPQQRIAWFCNFLHEVADTYTEWAQDADVAGIVNHLRARDNGLNACHVVRLLDFLVVKVGNQKLLQTP